MVRRLLGVLAYLGLTFPLGYVWHLVVFAEYYKKLEIYREDVLVPFGLAAMVTQGVVWTVIYEKMFAGRRVWDGAMRFAAIAFPLALSYQVFAVAAKNRMASVTDYVMIETAFVFVHIALVSPLIAWVYCGGEKTGTQRARR